LEDFRKKKKTREQFLKELANFLEGVVEPIEDRAYENSFMIRFEFEGEKFVYEDLEKSGFKDKFYFAHLKVKTPSKLTLTFAGKKRSMKIRSDIFIASDVSTQQDAARIQLQIPAHLKDLNVYTNDKVIANHFLEDKKVASIFKQLKNTDMRGNSFLPVEIVDGMVTLEFSSETTYRPNLPALKSDIPTIEDYSDKLMVLVRKLKEEQK